MVLDPGSIWLWVVLVGGTVFVLFLLLAMGQRETVDTRLEHVSHSGVANSDGLAGGESTVDRLAKRRLAEEERKERLRGRLMQAGFYSGAAASLFFAVRLALVAGGAGLGLVASRFGHLSLRDGLLLGTIGGVAATIAPGFFLDMRKRNRQTVLRRALPDALDVIVVCLQGGLSVMSALARVARELAVAHPLLAVELKIVERQMQMGQAAGDAIRGLAERFDLEELRGMAAVLKQAERVGSSVATALEVFAESMRLKRQQRAEAMAHKASVKMMFPTLFCIFPAIFVVILGPAAFQLYEKLVLGMLGK